MDLQDISMRVAGGALIGASSGALLLVEGRIAGQSGILAGLLDDDSHWRWAWLAGLLLGGLALLEVLPETLAPRPALPSWLWVLAGLLVGLGSRIGSGCTSGHGVCGVGRGSSRSLVATAMFVTTAALTVWATKLLGGGS